MQKISEHIRQILKYLPKSPGVYQMKDKNGKVIYVGKAINLHSRVGSYFRDNTSLSVAKRGMVKQITDIETILCQTGVEALVLETNLIKHLSPKYNILMKDDKDLAYIKITNSIVPEVIKTRQRINDGAKYYGPYTVGANITGSLKLLRRIFRIRACWMKFAEKNKSIMITDRAGRTPPCMDYYIGICPAPCLLDENHISKHNANLEALRVFLSGKQHAILEKLREDMMHHAAKQQFEEAGKIKADIIALETLSERQIARDALPGNQDVFVCVEKYNQYYIGITRIRQGHIVGVFRHIIDSRWEDIDAIITQFLAQEYMDKDDLPDTLIVPQALTDQSLRDWLVAQNIDIVIPQQGKRREMIIFTQNQVREFAYKQQLKSLSNVILSRTHMANILITLGITPPKKWPIIFECYDISHTHGHFTYASRVVIENGKPNISKYKKYKIRILQEGEIDDFASHEEVMRRRALEAKEHNNFPHLIIIDGGKWQLSSAVNGVLQWYYQENRGEWCEIPVHICSLAKREEEVFLPKQKKPVLFTHGTPELMVIQKARDEAHRFSLTANKSARNKHMKKNILEELPGIGPVTRKKLLVIAGSIEWIFNLSEDTLSTVLNRSQIETLRDHGLIR